MAANQGKRGECNVRMKPVDGEPRTHAQRAHGADFTLCGFTLDADRKVVEWEMDTFGPITCEQCWAIIEFCRTVKQRKLAREAHDGK
jgi:hypothetical protein